MRTVLGWTSVLASVLAVGCAGTVRVTPESPVSAPREAQTQVPVSLYIDPAIERLHPSATTPSGDLGLGDITAEFDLGPALANTIRHSAGEVFARVKDVGALACAEGTAVLFAASLPTPPYIQIHWRGQTPRVGGGTIAEVSVRIALQPCDGSRSLQSAVARGAGRSERLQVAANWPSEDDFQPGIDMALRDLQMHLVRLFSDMAKALPAP